MHTNIKQEAGQKLDTAVFMFLSRKSIYGEYLPQTLWFVAT